MCSALRPFGPWVKVELAAVVSEAEALGSVGTALRSPRELRQQWERVRELTDAPFAINHTGRPFNEEVFSACLDFGPAAISFQWVYQPIWSSRPMTAASSGCRRSATPRGRRPRSRPARMCSSLSTEAGGNAGWIGTLVLVPLIVDLAGDVPVVAAGGIADGRGIAAALALGAQGASLGTRFLATTETAVDPAWKQRIVSANALDAVKVAHSEKVMPPFTLPQVGVPFAPRCLRTPLIDQLEKAPATVDPAVVGHRLVESVRSGGGHDLLPFTGQSAGLVHEHRPSSRAARTAHARGRIRAERRDRRAEKPFMIRSNAPVDPWRRHCSTRAVPGGRPVLRDRSLPPCGQS
jgi:enoyl-[acyl-carrier protein] reductase II